MSDAMMVVTVAVVAVLVLIIVFMAVDGSGPSVTNVYSRFVRPGWNPGYGPGHSYRWGPYYQHGGRTPSNGLLY